MHHKTKNMEALEKAKLALREHLLANKAKVASDLDALRRKSEGCDIFNYVENLSNTFNFSNITVKKEVLYDFSFIEIDYYPLDNSVEIACNNAPPFMNTNIYQKIALKFFQGFSFS